MSTLTVSLVLARLGREPLILIATAALAVAVWAVLVPAAEREYKRQQYQLVLLRQTAAKAPKVDGHAKTPQDSRLQAFERRLASADDVSALQRQLWQQASSENLQLNKVDYRNEHEPAGQFGRLAITLPVSGSYSAIRRFVFALMEKFPGLSLDKLDLKRTSLGAADVEATIHFTLVVRP